MRDSWLTLLVVGAVSPHLSTAVCIIRDNMEAFAEEGHLVVKLAVVGQRAMNWWWWWWWWEKRVVCEWPAAHTMCAKGALGHGTKKEYRCIFVWMRHMDKIAASQDNRECSCCRHTVTHGTSAYMSRPGLTVTTRPVAGSASSVSF